jgi:hypothetical protein
LIHLEYVDGEPKILGEETGEVDTLIEVELPTSQEYEGSEYFVLIV